MSQMTPVKWQEFPLMLAPLSNPTVFNILCGIMSRTFKWGNTGNDVYLPDCTNESLMLSRYVEFDKEYLDIDADGKFAVEFLDYMFEWKKSGTSRPSKIPFFNPDGSVYGQFSFSSRLESIDLKSSAEGDKNYQCSLVIKSHGLVTWTKN